MYDEKKADRVVRFFQSLKHTKGTFHGQPFTLLSWERDVVCPVYGTVNQSGLRVVKYVYVEIPKKNGKSELCAGAGLYHTFADGEKNGEVYGCAADRQQASIVFDVAVDMVDQLPALKKRTKLRLSQKRLIDTVSGTYYQVLSAEAFTKHGLNLSACIFDELHAQPSRDLWDVMTFGAGDARRQPIWWIVTTAGDDPDRVSIGWEQHEYAMKVLAGEVIDPTWFPVIYSYDGDDIFNEENWAKANPSLGHTIQVETIREAAERARNKPAEEKLFRWLRLNQWLTTKLTTWLPLNLFDEAAAAWTNSGIKRADLAGRICYLGMDLSSTTDLTALALIFPPQGEQLNWVIIWEAFIPREGMKERVAKDHVPYDFWEKQGWINVTEGDVVDYTRVEARILELKALYDVQEIDSDPAFAAMLLQRLEQAGLTCVAVPQTFIGLTDAMNQFEVVLREHKVAVEPNPVARWCFGNTSIAKNGSGLIKFVKESKGKSVVRTKRIDVMAAAISAMARARFHKVSIDLSEIVKSKDWGM